MFGTTKFDTNHVYMCIPSHLAPSASGAVTERERRQEWDLNPYTTKFGSNQPKEFDYHILYVHNHLSREGGGGREA